MHLPEDEMTMPLALRRSGSLPANWEKLPTNELRQFLEQLNDDELNCLDAGFVREQLRRRRLMAMAQQPVCAKGKF